MIVFHFQYKFANDSNAEYTKTGKASLKFRLINQRADFSIALFSGGLSNVSHCLSLLFIYWVVLNSILIGQSFVCLKYISSHIDAVIVLVQFF